MSQQIQAVFRNRTIMIAITVFVGAVILFQEYFPTPIGFSATTKIGEVNSIFAAFFGIIGIVQLWRYNLPRIQRRVGKWYLSVLVLAAFLIRFVLTVWLGFTYEPVLKFFAAFSKIPNYVYDLVQLSFTYLIFAYYFQLRSIEFAFFAVGVMSMTLYMCTPIPVYAPWLFKICDWICLKGTASANYANALGRAVTAITMALIVLIGRETTGYIGRAE